MCGINGIVLKEKDSTLEYRIQNMNLSLKHRGPDAGKKVILNARKVAFGHRRLSVIDLNLRSTQPMMSASGRWTIIYNGEVYNYKELRIDTDYEYKTESDTEVILAYLDCFGIDAFLKKCNGMFSFAVYDSLNEELYLCRDRLGIKPLYYYSDGNKFIFSSEIKGILNSGYVNAVLDEESIDDYLAYRYVREPYTFFKNIIQVEAGTYVKLTSKFRIIQKKYWDLPEEFNNEKEYDEIKIYREFKKHLEDAVLKRTIADVPIGTYLSGGVDSSLLTAIVASNTNQKLNTYTIGFPELNEFEYSKIVAEKYHTLHHEIIIGKEDYLEEIKEIISFKDAPLGVPNEVPLAVMSKILKNDITVVLSGEGADELLGGYGRIFRSSFDYNNTKSDVLFYDYFIDKYEYVPRYLRDIFLQTKKRRRKIYDEEIKKKFMNFDNTYNIFYFFHKYHIKGLLQRVDTTTMLASVEARVPFLDHKLIEYVYKNVPYELKLHWKNDDAMKKASFMSANEYSEKLDIPKYLLKKVAAEYIPFEVINRKKVGFPVPLTQWSDLINKLLIENLNNAFWLRKNSVMNLIEQCQNYFNGNQILWMFLNIQLFIEMYFNKEWRY